RLGSLGWLFRDRWTMLGVYVALIAGYSSLRFLAGDTTGYIFHGVGSDDVEKLLYALFATSALMHFYFDGFIWKVSQPRIQEPLVDGDQSTSIAARLTPGHVHAAKWGALLGCIGLLLFAETRPTSIGLERQSKIANALASLTPRLPESLLLRSQAALVEGNLQEAGDLAWEAAGKRSRSASTLLSAGATLLESNQNERAVETLAKAAQLRPDDLDVVRYQATAEQQLGRYVASRPFAERLARDAPDSATGHYLLGRSRLFDGDPAGSVPHLRTAARLDPRHGPLQLDLGTAFYALGKWAQASEAFAAAASLLPAESRCWVNLGSAQLQLGQLEEAERSYRKGLELAPDSPQLNYNLGMLLVQTGRADEGERLLLRAARTSP
ncbi:MAG: tetratricopeptide repeat protein, partial [Planctomycetales bacterium]|nr:tetratricopeptide repeat protein [Planctomycetales bacterium]